MDAAGSGRWMQVALRALSGRRREHSSPELGRLSWYEAGPPGRAREPTPLLLIHSINAAPSAYEVKPLYDHYCAARPVYALDLPGFGFSERSDRRYTPRLMTDAIHAIVAHIRRLHGARAVDAIALSLSAEFLGRAACEAPQAFRSVAFVSPTGFDRPTLREGPAGESLAKPWLLALLTQLRLRRALFALLTRPRTIRRFLERSWGRREIDEGLWKYDCLTTRPAGAEFAPMHFLAGYLFSADSGSVYRRLQVPVWAVHGDRGAFTDFRALALLADRHHWHTDVMQTGALPHFERPQEFIERYESWLAGATRDKNSGQRAETPEAAETAEVVATAE